MQRLSLSCLSGRAWFRHDDGAGPLFKPSKITGLHLITNTLSWAYPILQLGSKKEQVFPPETGCPLVSGVITGTHATSPCASSSSQHPWLYLMLQPYQEMGTGLVCYMEGGKHGPCTSSCEDDFLSVFFCLFS